MRKPISCLLAAPLLLAVGAFAAQASTSDPLGTRAAPDGVQAVVVAQAEKAQKASSGKKTTKKKSSRRQPTKKEMDQVRQHVPKEYHQYLPKGQ
jgi:hypothetical protein